MMASAGASSIFAQLMAAEEFSDLTLRCQGQDFKVHRNIVCLQSPVFKAATQSGSEVSPYFQIRDVERVQGELT